MYQKYHTEALVLGSREKGESDRVYALFTKDFGLVRARASAVRKETSKMRYALSHYSRCGASLIRGKRGWRVAGATAKSSAFADVSGASAFARIAMLVKRLVHGEEKNDYLFAALSEAHSAFASAQRETVPTIEIVCVARVLFALGYISSEALGMALFTHTAYTGESLLEAETMKDKLLSTINKAITETHL